MVLFNRRAFWAVGIAWLLVFPAASASVAAEQAVPAEKNPPGDIPDSQVFVSYKSPLGFQLKVPEGWARADLPEGTKFSDKYGIVDVKPSNASAPPTAASVKSHEAEELKSTGHAVTIQSVKDVTLPAGRAVVIVYTSNSESNPVTGKKIRLENNRYIFFKPPNTEVAVDFAAPAGADNVDQWQLMSRSFKWN